MVHYHVHIEKDDYPGSRIHGALTLTREAGELEAQIEMSAKGVPSRRAHVDQCNEDCFGIMERA